MNGVRGVPASPGGLLDALRSGRIEGREARLRAAAMLLEGSFYQELFKAMRDTVPEGGLVSSRSQEVFSDLMDQHLAEAASSSQDRGIGRALYRHFMAAASGADPDSPFPSE